MQNGPLPAYGDDDNKDAIVFTIIKWTNRHYLMTDEDICFPEDVKGWKPSQQNPSNASLR